MTKKGTHAYAKGRVRFTWSEGDGNIAIVMNNVEVDTIGVWKYGAKDNEQMTGRAAFKQACDEWMKGMSKQELNDLAQSAGL